MVATAVSVNGWLPVFYCVIFRIVQILLAILIKNTKHFLTSLENLQTALDRYLEILKTVSGRLYNEFTRHKLLKGKRIADFFFVLKLWKSYVCRMPTVIASKQLDLNGCSTYGWQLTVPINLIALGCQFSWLYFKTFEKLIFFSWNFNYQEH